MQAIPISPLEIKRLAELAGYIVDDSFMDSCDKECSYELMYDPKGFELNPVGAGYVYPPFSSVVFR